MVAIAPSQKKIDDKNKEANVQVFVRIRPLIAEEQGQALMDYKTNDTKSAIKLKVPSLEESSHVNPALTPPPLKTRTEDQWKTFLGFTDIFLPDSNNEQVYQTTLYPLVRQLVQHPHQSACLFTYGHTGSGKSHTLLGYGKEVGIYKYAARDLLHQLQKVNPDIGLLVRVTELYKEQVLDLVQRQECTLRQDAKGIMQLRGPIIEDEEGRFIQQPLGAICCTLSEIMDCVEAACSSRRVGISTHHSQSSRSHLVLEMEVVTPQFLQARDTLHAQEAHWTRLKWLQTERLSRRKDPKPFPKWAQVYLEAGPSKLRKETQEYEKLVQESQKRVAQLSKSLGGTLVVCDLAGNEYAQDSRASTKEELEEAAEINKSLLAVKEVIRSLGNNHNNNTTRSSTKTPHNHVPYRDSKLTMMLRRHLNHRAIMMAHISPSQESIRKTINTLKYGAMVAKTSSATSSVGTSNTTSASSPASSPTKTPESSTARPSSAARRQNAGPKPWATKRR